MFKFTEEIPTSSEFFGGARYSFESIKNRLDLSKSQNESSRKVNVHSRSEAMLSCMEDIHMMGNPTLDLRFPRLKLTLKILLLLH